MLNILKAFTSTKWGKEKKLMVSLLKVITHPILEYTNTIYCRILSYQTPTKPLAQMVGAFMQPGPRVSLLIDFKMTDRNRTYQNGRVSTHSNVQCGSANRQTSFSGRGNARIKLPFSGHIANKFRRPAILQLNIKGLTASKMNVLHHLAMQSEALVILLQETHCTDAEKLVLPNYQLAGSSLSRKHGLATFVHKRLRYTLLDQSPPTSEIEWLCMDVDGYKIVNVYKPPPTQLRTLDLPVFPHPCLYAGNFNCCHADWGYNDNSLDGECLAGWASINCLALLYNAKDAASYYSGCWNTGTNPDLAFASVGPNSRLPDRRVLEKFPRSQHRPSLITPPRFAMAVPSMPVKHWNFHKAKRSHYIALTNTFAKTLLLPDSLDVDAAYQDFCNTIKKAAKKTIPHGYQNNYIPCWDAECESLYKTFLPSFTFLREMTQVWLLQLCLPSLTESRGIDGPRQFGALTSYTLVEKRRVF